MRYKFMTPSLIGVFKDTANRAIDNVNVAGMAKVIELHEKTGTVDVELVAIPRTESGMMKNFNDEPGAPIFNVPIIMSYCTKPLYQGDNVLLVVNDTDLDIWYSTDERSIPNSRRTHDLSDAVAIAGIDNLVNTKYKEPEWYVPRTLPHEILYSPYNQFEYDQTNANFNFQEGDVRVGDGVTITSRGNRDISMYSEGGSINLYPTVNFAINNTTSHFVMRGFTPAMYAEGVMGTPDGRFTISNENRKKTITIDDSTDVSELDGLLDGDTVCTSDIYRILRFIKAALTDISSFIGGGFASELISGDTEGAGLLALAFPLEFIQRTTELGARIDALFKPYPALHADGTMDEL